MPTVHVRRVFEQDVEVEVSDEELAALTAHGVGDPALQGDPCPQDVAKTRILDEASKAGPPNGGDWAYTTVFDGGDRELFEVG